jgi:hypothetical protein
MSALSVLDRDHTVASRGFSRWMVPPAALCVHLCIGQAYAFSVFNLPMTKLIGISESTPEDWKLTELGWIFSIAIFALGFSAALFRRLASIFTISGLFISATVSLAVVVSASVIFPRSPR